MRTCRIAAVLVFVALASCAQGPQRAPARDGPSPGGHASDSAATGTATLSWIPPTTRTDGTPLGDLAGYRLHYGTEEGRYSQVVEVNDPQQTHYTLRGLTPGTYCFAVSAVDRSGRESALSNPACKEIEQGPAGP